MSIFDAIDLSAIQDERAREVYVVEIFGTKPH
jgi:hypothetical protein